MRTQSARTSSVPWGSLQPGMPESASAAFIQLPLTDRVMVRNRQYPPSFSVAEAGRVTTALKAKFTAPDGSIASVTDFTCSFGGNGIVSVLQLSPRSAEKA